MYKVVTSLRLYKWLCVFHYPVLTCDITMGSLFLQPENYRLETKYENHLIVKVALVCI